MSITSPTISINSPTISITARTMSITSQSCHEAQPGSLSPRESVPTGQNRTQNYAKQIWRKFPHFPVFVFESVRNINQRPLTIREHYCVSSDAPSPRNFDILTILKPISGFPHIKKNIFRWAQTVSNTAFCLFGDTLYSLATPGAILLKLVRRDVQSNLSPKVLHPTVEIVSKILCEQTFLLF